MEMGHRMLRRSAASSTLSSTTSSFAAGGGGFKPAWLEEAEVATLTAERDDGGNEVEDAAKPRPLIWM